MRIEYVAEVDLAKPDGPTAHVLGIATAFQQLGHEVTLLLPPLSGRAETNLPIDIVPVSKYSRLMRPAFALTGARHALKRLRSLPPDLVYCRVGHFTRPGPVIAKHFGIPMISEVNGITEKHLSAIKRSRTISRYILSHEQECLRLSTRIICVTEEIRQHVLTRDPALSPENVLAIPNGVDSELFHPQDKIKSRQELGIPTDSLVIGYLGTFEWWQGMGVLFAAFKRVASKLPKACLVLAGFRGEIDLEAEIIKHGLAGRVITLGEIPLTKAGRCISSFDLCVACVMPLGREQKSFSPIKLFTYMACARPTVGSDLPGFEVLKQYDSGRLFPAGDDKTLADILIELADAPAICEAMGNSGREAIEKHFTWLTVAKTTLAGLKT